MAEEATQLPSIDFDGLSRFASQRRWREDSRSRDSRELNLQKFPFSSSSDPLERLKVQGIRIGSAETTPVVSAEASVEERKSRLKRGSEIYRLRREQEEAYRYKAASLRDLEVQGALVAEEHQIYEIIQRVAGRIAQAQKRTASQEQLANLFAADQFDYYMTKREEINASSIKLGRCVFLESGLLVLLHQYLQEVKGYGLSEDHLAFILTHEISHSDPQSARKYLKEEYCDVQGLILGAQAGYNPLAALDVEDFFIWLEEEIKPYKEARLQEEKERTDEKDKIKIPPIKIGTHPNPQNRRLVLINVLKDPERFLPNQDKKFTPVDVGIVEDLASQMREWQGVCQARLLPQSWEEVTARIREVKTLGELLDVLMGSQLLKRAEYARAVADDQVFADKMTLIQAVALEARKHIEGNVVFSWRSSDARDRELEEDLQSIILARGFEGYSRADIVIGGLASNISFPSITPLDSAKPIKDEIKGELADLRPVVLVSAGIVSISSAERQAKEAAAEQKGIELTEKLSKLYQYITRDDIKIDIARLLAGDFTQDLTLQAMLEDLGITDFHHYLAFLADNFRDLQPNSRIAPLMGERLQALYPNGDILSCPVSQLNREQIRTLLEETKYARLASAAERGMKQLWGTSNPYAQEELFYLDNELQKEVDDKLRELAEGMSTVSQEQQLIFELLRQCIFGIDPEGKKFDLEKQIAFSTVTQGGMARAHRQILETYQTAGIPKSLADLRVAPAKGGSFLSSFVCSEGGDYRTDTPRNIRTGWLPADSTGRRLGINFDFVRLFYGLGDFQQQEGPTWSRAAEYIPRLRPLDIAGLRKYTAAKAGIVPVYGDSTIKFAREEELKAGISSELPQAEFKFLQEVAEVTNYQSTELGALMACRSAGVEERGEYFIQGLEAGKFDLETISKLIEERIYFYESGVITAQEIEELRDLYQLGMYLLKYLPVGNFGGSYLYNLESISKSLYSTRLNLLRWERINSRAPMPFSEFQKTDPFAGLSEEAKLTAQLEDIFSFIEEGGVVSLSRCVTTDSGYIDHKLVDWANIFKSGISLDIMGIIEGLGYPAALVENRVNQLLQKNAGRYRQEEVDKWISLTAWCRQPYLEKMTEVNISYRDAKKKPAKIKVSTNGHYTELDCFNVDDVLTLSDRIMELPSCSYRDRCLYDLCEIARKAVCLTYETRQRGRPKLVEYDHPAEPFLSKRIGELMATGFSPMAYRESASLIMEFIPLSEAKAGDVVAGTYFHSTLPNALWSKLLTSPSYRRSLTNPFSLDYRRDPRLSHLNSTDLERFILYERLRLIQDMPESELKDSLYLFALQTAWEALPNLEEAEGLAEELDVLINDYTVRARSLKCREKLLIMQLRHRLGCREGPLAAEQLRAEFPQREDFLSFVQERLPEKTVARDSLILMASEAYPLAIGDAIAIEDQLFSCDYGTQDPVVLKQRAGLEFIRTLKGIEGIKPADFRGFILWIVDERRHVRSIDDFLKLTADRRQLERIKQFFSIWGVDLDKTTRKGRAIDVVITALSALPLWVKKKLVEMFLVGKGVSAQDLDFITRTGMPAIIEKAIKEGLIVWGSQADMITFNSLIEATNLESPLGRSIFFDLCLGDNGLLEEPVELNASDFSLRMQEGFAGSEMHLFIDDIIDIFVNKSRVGRKEERVIRAIGHSLIEALPPLRRAEVLYNFLLELSKVDYQAGQSEIQSQVMNIALSALGVLGAKMGQTDELMPSGWGEEAGSLKHNQRPLPFLAVAEIFAHEGLSPQYTIIKAAGAASTACGYIIANPFGEKQFCKVIRPDVALTVWQDFKAVEHMIACLKETGLIDFEVGPVISQLRTLVSQEIQTGREIENVIQYVEAETETDRLQRGGIRAVKMPLPKIGSDGKVMSQEEAEGRSSLLIIEELLPSGPDGFIELSRIKSERSKSRDKRDPEIALLDEQIDWERVNEIIVSDFLYRALQIGVWHADPHEGNIMVSKQGIVRKKISPEDLVYIDFGQIGTAEGEARRETAARLLAGLALYDREEVSRAIFSALTPEEREKGTTIDEIRSSLAIDPSRLQKSAMKALSKYKVEDYLTNFLKATVNILPYLRALPKKKQYFLIASWIPKDMRAKVRTRLIARVVS